MYRYEIINYSCHRTHIETRTGLDDHYLTPSAAAPQTAFIFEPFASLGVLAIHLFVYPPLHSFIPRFLSLTLSLFFIGLKPP